MWTSIAGVLLVVCGVSPAVNPGVKGRVTQKGLNYANTIAQAALASELSHMDIADQSGKSGDINWDFKHIQNKGVTAPSSQIKLDPAHHGLQWKLSDLGLKLKADWKIKYHKAIIRASTSGSVDVSIKRVSIDVSISLDKGRNGRPSLKTSTCKASIGDVGLNFHGGTGWLINLFKSPLEKKVENILEKKVCNIVKKQIDVNGQKSLGDLKVSVNLLQNFTLDYSLIDTPVVTDTYMDVADKGEVFWRTDRTEAPYSPGRIPASSAVNKMLYLWITEYTLRTFAYAAQSHNFLTMNVTTDGLTDDDSIWKSRCSSVCVGSVLPGMDQKYPNSTVKKVRISSLSTPGVYVRPSGIQVALKPQIEMFARTEDGQLVQLLTLDSVMNLTLDAYIEKERLVGRVTQFGVTFSFNKSSVGTVQPFLLNMALIPLMSVAVVPKINEKLLSGLDLPVTDGVQFSHANLTLLQGSLLIATDVVYGA